MQVFLQIVAFSLQTDWSGRPVLTKGKRPRIFFIEDLEAKSGIISFPNLFRSKS